MSGLVFGGGTMLRLCHELPRYSVDLDFWFTREMASGKYFKKLTDFLGRLFEITDAKNKHFTLLIEFRAPLSEMRLKIEVRKEIVRRGAEKAIAYSKYADRQVLLTALSLGESAKRKVSAACARGEIRDFFDLEFMIRKKAPMIVSAREVIDLTKRIQRFTKEDFSSVLGGLLERDLRGYYVKNRFSYLQSWLDSSPTTS